MKLKDLLKDAYSEGMSLEDIESALENIELPVDMSAEVDKLKSALSKSNSEAADYKRQLKEKMSSEELKEKEDADRWAEMEEKYNALLKKEAISSNKSRLVALGYEESLAEETAEAMVNNDLEKIFANQKKHIEAVEKKARSEKMKGTPKPEGGSSSDTMTKKKLRGMTPQERYNFSMEHPEEYKQLYGGNE